MGIFDKVLPSLAKADERLLAQMTDAVAKRDFSHLGELASVSEKVRAAIAEIESIEPPAAPPPPAPAKRRARHHAQGQAGSAQG